MKRILTIAALLAVSASTYAASPALTVYKDPNCGCCEAWVKHVNQAGFRIKVIDSSDVATLKAKLGVPAHLPLVIPPSSMAAGRWSRDMSLQRRSGNWRPRPR
ncbi:hypothetical protein [Cupriavidus gilardii]|uniref:hypothetical protein n=1 Tax=Cupriavidus gilardii TaxID=82541 RepID=UPI003B27BA63